VAVRALLTVAIVVLAGSAHSLGAAPAESGAAIQVSGDLRVWSPVTLTLTGPESREDGTPNPFLDYRLRVTFTNGDRSVVVPGYFAADGKAADTGATSGPVFRARFVPDEAGDWRYTVSFRAGDGVALNADENAGAPLAGDGARGRLHVEPDGHAPGMLRYTGARYLRFAGTGEPFLKSGADSPENFLAYADFDGAGSGTKGAAREGEAAVAPRHAYAPHVRDFRDGDPTWGGGRGKGIIGALDYLASRGVNSVYFLTMNVAGDGNDVWPWTAADERFRFDCSKLDQWDVVFSHMDRLGIALHVVLTETENESLFELEEGAAFFAKRRRLYYRELVARFAHHRAIVWNLGEENGWDDRSKTSTSKAGYPNSHEQRQAFADFIRLLDPYDHPIVVHTLPGRFDEIYTPLLGHPSFEGASLQIARADDVHSETLKWVVRSREAGRPWFVDLDEIGPPEDGVVPDAEDPDHDFVRHHALWGNLMAGGAGCEWYFGYKHPDNDLDTEDFRSRENMWKQTRVAVDFFRRHLPFTEMEPRDDLVTPAGAWCLAKPGEVYAVYLPRGGDGEIDLGPEPGTYEVVWLDPKSGGELRSGSAPKISGPGRRSLGAPPGPSAGDWAVLVRRAR
jgi:hypothetical protein